MENLNPTNKLITPTAKPLLGPDGLPLNQPVKVRQGEKPYVPWVMVLFEKFPDGVRGKVRIRETDDPVTVVQSDFMQPTFEAAMDKLKEMIGKRINRTQETNGKGDLHTGQSTAE